MELPFSAAQRHEAPSRQLVRYVTDARDSILPTLNCDRSYPGPSLQKYDYRGGWERRVIYCSEGASHDDFTDKHIYLRT